MGQKEKAIADLEKALELWPNDRDAKAELEKLKSTPKPATTPRPVRKPE